MWAKKKRSFNLKPNEEEGGEEEKKAFHEEKEGLSHIVGDQAVTIRRGGPVDKEKETYRENEKGKDSRTLKRGERIKAMRKKRLLLPSAYTGEEVLPNRGGVHVGKGRGNTTAPGVG